MLATNETLSQLNSQASKVVSMNHESETYVPTIVDTKYHEKNYLQRKVIKPQEIKDLRGGEVIDILAKRSSYAGGRHKQSNGPIYKQDIPEKPASPVTISASPYRDVMASQELVQTSDLMLPDLLNSPRHRQGERVNRNSVAV